jgi:hypothetical protein
MLGAILGSVGGGLINGLMDNVMGGNNGGGLLGGLGDIAGKLLDPLGLFSGNQEQSTGSDEIKGLLEEIKAMFEELLAQFCDQQETTDGADQPSDAAPFSGGPIYVDGGSGDDVITIGQPVAAG